MAEIRHYKLKVTVNTETKKLNDLKNKLINLQQTVGAAARQSMLASKKNIVGLQYDVKGAESDGRKSLRRNIGEQKQALMDAQSVQREASNKAIGNTKKQINVQKEITHQANRFKGEWLSMMFVIQAATQPFTNVLNKVFEASGAFEALGAVLVAILLPVFMPFLQFIIKLAGWLAKNKEKVDGFIAMIVGFMSILGGIIGIVAGIFLGLSVGASLAIGAIIAFFVGLIAAIITHWDKFTGFVRATINNIIGFFMGIFRTFAAVWDLIFGDGEDKWATFADRVGEIWNGVWENIKAAAGAAWDFISAIWTDMTEGIGAFFSGIGEWLGFGKKQFGGEIKKSGLYYMHAGEEVISNSPAGNQGNTFNNISISDVSVSDNIDIDSLARRVGNQLGRGI